MNLHHKVHIHSISEIFKRWLTFYRNGGSILAGMVAHFRWTGGSKRSGLFKERYFQEEFGFLMTFVIKNGIIIVRVARFLVCDSQTVTTIH